MSPKPRTTFLCSECGESFSTWSGKCSSCGQWNTLTKFQVPGAASGGSAGRAADRDRMPAEFLPLSVSGNTPTIRAQTFSGELNTVLGGGIVPGSAMVLGGDPGIGKSTLSLQLVHNLKDALYVAGEESPEQIRLRAERLGLMPTQTRFATSTNVLDIIAGVQAEHSSLLVVDSIQTLYHPDFPSTPGSIVQIRESAMSLVQFAKQTGLAIILIGHVTKEGTIAGPRLLEHLVDVVLYLEGDRYGQARLLRSVKNRFGPAGEVGVLEMTEMGLKDVTDPARVFLDDLSDGAPGRAIACVLEGNRPFLVEIQALVAASNFAAPRRAVSGFDLARLHVLLAVLEARSGVKLANKDVYINVVGGMQVKDRGADLAVALAVTSAAKGKAPPKGLAVFGELGLTGEIRPVALADRRVREAEKSGLKPLLGVKRIADVVATI